MPSSRLEEFWQWTLQRYESDALREQLLLVQDQHGFMVIEVLIAGWLASVRLCYTHAARQAGQVAALPWYVEVVVPLRRTRREWRGIAARQSVRERLQQLELSAERDLADILLMAILPRLTSGAASLSAKLNFEPLTQAVPSAARDLQRIADLIDG